jgi:ABC-type branched-subunit amino acid transport system substrate-binding protein
MKTKVLAVSLTATASLILAACGSGGGDGGSGDPIKIMQIAAESVVGSGDNQDGVIAAVKSINAAGGIDGRKIEYIHCNAGPSATNGNPNSTAQCAQKAVQEKVVALVGTFTTYSQNLYPYIKRAGIPNINQQFSAPDQTEELSYPQAGSTATAYAGISDMLAKDGCKRIALLAVGTAAQVKTLVVKPMQLGAKAGGAETLEPQYIYATATDYAPAVATIRSQGADCINFEGSAANTAPLMKALRESGKPLKVGVNDISVPHEVIDTLSAKDQANILVETLNYPREWQTEGVKKYEADMKKYRPKAVLVDYTQLLWGYVRTFEQAAKAVAKDGKDVNAKNVKEALDKICATDNDIAPPANYCEPGKIKKMPRVSVTSNVYMKIVDGKYVPDGSGPDDVVDVGDALTDYDPNS